MINSILSPKAAGSAFWTDSIWISAADSPVRNPSEDPFKGKAEAEDGTALFTKYFTNPKPVSSAIWTMSGLGIFRAFANGEEVGSEDLFKPGFTHYAKTKHSFSYDVTAFLHLGEGEVNILAAYVSSGWWRDKITRFRGRRSAFRAVLVLSHPDGTETRIATDTTWNASGQAGPVVRAAIFDGEDFDARLDSGFASTPENAAPAIENTEFHGEIIPMEGPTVGLRRDLAMSPVTGYVWRGIEGADDSCYGHVVIIRKIASGNAIGSLKEGETLVLDFGQNCAAVPEFTFSATRGVTIVARPAEMLNDGNGDKSRRCDGPAGSVFIAEYRHARTRARYTFANDGIVTYRPSFTFYGGRYLSVTVEGGAVEIANILWIPVSSVSAESETASLETSDPSLNRFIANVLWGQRSNYLSIPTDCPQRAERLGWTADTQVFAKAACYNSSATLPFLRKWLRDLRDSRHPDGGYPGVAPTALIGDSNHQFGWADAGIIVPYTLWRHFGDIDVIRENWDAMSRYLALVGEMKYDSPEAREHQWADWLSLEKLETASGRAYVGGLKNTPPVKEDALTLWRFFGACYWLMDARMMAEMADALLEAGDFDGNSPDNASPSVQATFARQSANRALDYIRTNFIDPTDGLLIPLFRDMQTPALFALHLKILDPEAAIATRDALLNNIRAHGTCLQTGFLGTAMILDVLTDDCNAPDLAYSLLLQHGYPSWLYSVDQGATTVWESWDAYTVANGFSEGVRSFNHYAYGAIFAWMMAVMAGIREDPAHPGWKHFILKPMPDRRIGHASARYRSPCGEITSSWRFEGNRCRWLFSIPEGTSATVFFKDMTHKEFSTGNYEVIL